MWGGGGGWGSSPKKICKLMCNRLRTLRIGRYAPDMYVKLCKIVTIIVLITYMYFSVFCCYILFFVSVRRI